MKVCGVELKGGEAILCLLAYDKGAFTVIECRQRLFTVSDSESAESIQGFQFAFKKLMEDYHINEIAIIQRPQKGKYAGSATSFKLEAAIQLLAMPVTMLSMESVKALEKRNPLLVDMEALGLKKFQYPAFKVAYGYQNQLQYGELS